MSAHADSTGRRRVLIVDDDGDLRENLTELLTSAGYEVVSASNTSEALERLRKEDFDLLLTDLRMPGASGIELIDVARRNHPKTQAILMTAYGSPFTEIEVVRRGGIGYLQKPFEADEVTNLVGNILSLAEE